MTLELKSAGLRITLPRKQILRVFESAENRHLSAEDIHQKIRELGDEISLATIYRVLRQYEESGLLIKRSFEGNRAMYELNDDEHHDHLVCVACNRVEEFFDAAIDAKLSEIANTKGYQRSDHSLTVYGLCHDCAEKNSATAYAE